jgi:hypothetical protein
MSFMMREKARWIRFGQDGDRDGVGQVEIRFRELGSERGKPRWPGTNSGNQGNSRE